MKLNSKNKKSKDNICGPYGAAVLGFMVAALSLVVSMFIWGC